MFRTLVSSGAYDFAITKGVETTFPEAMISPSATSEWQKWKERLENLETNQSRLVLESASIHNIQDTVGAVAWTSDGGMAAGVSRQVFRGCLGYDLETC